MTKHDNKFLWGIQTVLGIVALMGGATVHGGEWEPVVPSVVETSLEIGIKNLDFTNSETGSVTNHLLIIPKGMEVKWINKDPLTTMNGEQGLMPHGIQILDSHEKVFSASPILTQDHDTFAYKFGEDGTFSYACFIHPFMKGKIVVVNLQKKGHQEGEPK
jgi:plastocyanin